MDKRYYFLHSKSLDIKDYDNYKIGLQKLLVAQSFLSDLEIVAKHDSVWYHECFCKLCCDNNETSGLIKFLHQCKSLDTDIQNDEEFELLYPKINVGFWGVDFSDIDDIVDERKVICDSSLSVCQSYYLKKRIEDCNKEQLEGYLSELYPRYHFNDGAIDDIDFWRGNNKDVLDRLHTLLADIPEHPFTGGKGKTEVLKYDSSKSSKRLTHADRLTYSYNTNVITVFSCRTHYQ